MSTAIQTRLHPRFRDRSNMLASVKEGLYHPMLPTFRRMDMDTAGHKLPEEHSRTTTPLTKGTLIEIKKKTWQTSFFVGQHIKRSYFFSDDFRSSTITLFRPADKPLSGTVSRYITVIPRYNIAEYSKLFQYCRLRTLSNLLKS